MSTAEAQAEAHRSPEASCMQPAKAERMSDTEAQAEPHRSPEAKETANRFKKPEQACHKIIQPAGPRV